MPEHGVNLVTVLGATEPSTPEKSGPSLYLDDEQVKRLGIEHAELDEKFEMLVYARVKSHSMDKTPEGERHSVTLELTEAEIVERDKGGLYTNSGMAP